MKSIPSFTNNGLSCWEVYSGFKKSRHGKHKNPNYHKEYYLKNRDNILAKRRQRYHKTKVLKPQKSVLDYLENDYRYQNWEKVVGKPWNIKWGYKKDGSDVKDPKLLKQESWDAKQFLKVIKTWNLNRQERRQWSKYIEFDQAGVALGVKKSYYDYRFGCIDIDCRGYTALFKNTYISNRIGSVHFYFLYKENDLGKKNLKVNIGDFKADFKMCQYMMAPLSLHHTGRLYLIKGRGSFFVGNYEKSSEVYKVLEQRVKELQAIKQWKREQRLLKQKIKLEQECKTQIQALPKSLYKQHVITY